MKIRPAEEHQREDWLDMRLDLWPDCPRPESSREITRILQSEREAGFVAIDQSGRVVGFAEVSTREYVDGCSTSPVGYLEGLYVRPECRGQGIGRALAGAAEDWAKARGCTEMGSDAELTDTRSIAFHQAMGYTETARQIVFLKRLRWQDSPMPPR